MLTSRAESMLTQASISELGDLDLAALFGVELADASLWSSELQPEKEEPKPEAKKKARVKSSQSKKSAQEQLLYIQKYTKRDARELAKQLSSTAASVSKWLSGRHSPSAPVAVRIKKLYNEVREVVQQVRSQK